MPSLHHTFHSFMWQSFTRRFCEYSYRLSNCPECSRMKSVHFFYYRIRHSIGSTGYIKLGPNPLFSIQLVDKTKILAAP